MASDRDSRQGVRAWSQDEVPAETDHLNAIAEVDTATDSECDGPPDFVESSDEDFGPGPVGLSDSDSDDEVSTTLERQVAAAVHGVSAVDVSTTTCTTGSLESSSLGEVPPPAGTVSSSPTCALRCSTCWLEALPVPTSAPEVLGGQHVVHLMAELMMDECSERNGEFCGTEGSELEPRAPDSTNRRERRRSVAKVEEDKLLDSLAAWIADGVGPEPYPSSRAQIKTARALSTQSARSKRRASFLGIGCSGCLLSSLICTLLLVFADVPDSMVRRGRVDHPGSLVRNALGLRDSAEPDFAEALSEKLYLADALSKKPYLADARSEKLQRGTLSEKPYLGDTRSEEFCLADALSKNMHLADALSGEGSTDLQRCYGCLACFEDSQGRCTCSEDLQGHYALSEGSVDSLNGHTEKLAEKSLEASGPYPLQKKPNPVESLVECQLHDVHWETLEHDALKVGEFHGAASGMVSRDRGIRTVCVDSSANFSSNRGDPRNQFDLWLLPGLDASESDCWFLELLDGHGDDLSGPRRANGWRQMRIRTYETSTVGNTSACELFYLHHMRTCCASPAGCRGTSSGLGEYAADPLAATIINFLDGCDARASRALCFLSRLGAWLFKPLGEAPLLVLVAMVAPAANAKVGLTASHVLLATLGEMHFGQPLCSILTAAAAWDLLDGHAWSLKVCACIYMALISPAFPMDTGTPLRNERVTDLLEPDTEIGALVSDLISASPQSQPLGTDQQVGLTQQFRDLSMTDSYPDTCPVCLDPLQSGELFSWPSCGSVQHQLHLACTTVVAPLQHALAHLRVTGDASRISNAPCIICRTPWGADDAGTSAVERLCTSLEAVGIPLPSRGCRCTECRAASAAQDQAFEQRYSAARASEMDRLFASAIAQARNAPDSDRFIERRKWSDFVVPLMWMAAASDGNSAEWPRVLENLCSSMPTNHESGLVLGPASIREAWNHLRAAFRASNFDCMEDLRNCIRDNRGEICAWAFQDSRFIGLQPADDHFNVGRGAHFEGYIQEWLVHSAEQHVGSNIGTLLSVNLQSAVRHAAQLPSASAAVSANGQRGPAPCFVQGDDLVTGANWRGGGEQQPSSDLNAVVPGATDATESSQSSQRRRLDVGGAYASGRCYCPVPGCPLSDHHRAQGWQSTDSDGFRAHLDEHASGLVSGAIPQEWLHDHSLGQCVVCSRVLHRRFGNAHPRCRPLLAPPRSEPASQRPLPAGCPDLKAIFETPIKVKDRVPKGARHLWAQCLLTAMAGVVRHNDVRAWTELLALPKMVLCAEIRGGRRHQRRAEAETKQRCQRWLEGQRRELWNPRAMRRPPNASPDDAAAEARAQEQRHERTVELLRETLLQKASSALVQAPPLIVDDHVVQEMRTKHPQARADEHQRITSLREVATAAATSVDKETVSKALRTFSRGSGCGPSGLRPQHLKEALVPGLRDEIERHMMAVVNLLSRGLAPTAVHPWLCGASLVALPKPCGGLRPIAVGETWRRLVGKTLAATIAEPIRAHLEPVQVGVGSKGGAEAIIHVARQWLHRNRSEVDKVLVTLDLENAFNSIDRSAFLAAARQICPGIVPWVDFCYREPSYLVLGGRRLTSGRGIQQGDPLGPALFSIAIHYAVLQARREAERLHPGQLDFVAFYLDDGAIAGRAAAAKTFSEVFQREMVNIGLVTNVEKCEVVPSCLHSTVSHAQFSGYQWREDGCFKLLGAPLGNQDFCEAHTGKRVLKAKVLQEAVGDFAHAQGALQVLRHCASWCKLVYSTRTVPPDMHSAALCEFNANLRRCLEKIVGDALPDRAWGLAQLGILQGGLGIRDPAAHAPAAYFASVLQTVELCTKIDGAYDASDRDGGSHVASVQEALRDRVLEAASWDRGAATISQKELSSMIDAASLQALCERHRADAPFQAHIALCRMPGAGAWITAPPVDDGREIDAPLFQVDVKRRLRAPVYAADSFCPCCGDLLDKYGDHALTCSCGGDRTVRHNSIRNVCFEEATLAGTGAEREKAGLLPERPESDEADELPQRRSLRRPADVWLPRAQGDGPEALDFAVTSAMRTSLLREATATPELLFQRYEQYKKDYQNTADLCHAAGLRFVPMVVEAHSGGWSPLARATLDWIAKKRAALTHEQPDVIAFRIAQRLSATLHRENSRAILKRSASPLPDEFATAWATSEGAEA